MPTVHSTVDKAAIMATLATLSPQEVISLLSQDVRDQLANPAVAVRKATPVVHQDPSEQRGQLIQRHATTAGAGEKPKRVLNSYLAFRTYYSSMLRIQQKEVSSFTTILWQCEHFTDRWTLIAKVYSFVRDEVGIKNCPLKPFLRVACPIMKIVPPDSYIQTFFWSVSSAESPGLVQDRKAAKNAAAAITQSGGVPTTELDLLSACIPNAFSSEHAPIVLAKMRAKSTGLMTLSSPGNDDKKVNFINALISDPINQAGTIIGVPADNDFFRFGVNVFHVDDVNAVGINLNQHGSATVYPVIRQDSVQTYPYEENYDDVLRTHHPDIDLEAFSDDMLDIGNAYHLDGVIEDTMTIDLATVDDAEPGFSYNEGLSYQTLI